MNLAVAFDYLSGLEQNNNRDWYHENKQQHKQAEVQFEDLIRRILLEIREFDNAIPLSDPKELTFKLTRDTRFSHDKSPYNPSFRAHMGAAGKLPIPVGYYIMLKPGGGSFLGGGLFGDMFQNATAMVRDFIASNPEQWQSIVESSEFTRHFTVGGTRLKNIPRGYDPALPQAEYLKNKSWYLEYPVSDEQVTAADFARQAAEIFQKMKPFNDFLNRALRDFVLPQR